MRFSKLLFTLTSLSIFAITLLSFTGCGESKYQMPEAEKSAQGVVLEDFFPEDVLMALTINTLDESQQKNFEILKSYFPSEDFDNLIISSLEDMNMKLTEYGLTYEQDLAPLYSGKFKAIMGMTGSFPKITKNKKTDTKEPQESPDIIFAFTVADPQKTGEIIQLIADKNPDANKTEVFGFTALDNEKENMYLALYKDTVVMTNSADKRFEAVKRIRNNENSLLSNQQYKKAMESLPRPNLGVAYINVYKLFDEIGKAQGVDQENMEAIKALQYEAFSFVADKDGMELIAQVGMDPNNKLFNIDNFKYQDPYLYKNLPGKDLIMYAESYDLKQIFDLEMQMLLNEEVDKKDFENGKKMIKKAIGLDVDNDILSWMDKGYSFVLQRNSELMPGISIYIDAGSDPKGADKTLKIINAALEQFLDEVFNRGDPIVAKVLKKEIFDLGENGGQINCLSIDYTLLTEEERTKLDIPEGTFNEPIRIFYGLTKDNIFILSTYSKLAEEWGNTDLTVAQNSNVKESLGYIKGYPYQLTYINLNEVIKYAEGFVDLMERVKSESIPKDVAKAYEKIKNYLAPIKYLVGGNKKVENIAEGLLFIKMEKQ